MNEWTYMLLRVVVSICAAVITAYLIPYLRTIVSDKRYGALLDMVALAVRAAEQTIRDSGQGAIKKERVVALVHDWMEKQGITITEEQLSDLIEACVYQMKQEAK